MQAPETISETIWSIWLCVSHSFHATRTGQDHLVGHLQRYWSSRRPHGFDWWNGNNPSSSWMGKWSLKTIPTGSRHGGLVNSAVERGVLLVHKVVCSDDNLIYGYCNQYSNANVNRARMTLHWFIPGIWPHTEGFFPSCALCKLQYYLFLLRKFYKSCLKYVRK